MAIQDRVTGIQHIGIPSANLEKTIQFYQSLGFEVQLRTGSESEPVAFLRLKNTVIEAYQSSRAALQPGAIDHIALDVDDIEKTYQEVHALGYQELENGIQFLPFWTNGVRFFTIPGPNAEKVEFSQML